MGRIVGNLFKLIACLALFFNVMHANIMLRVVSMEGEPLEYAGMGQPFMLEVTITDMGKNLSDPEIKGDTEITIHRTGLFISTVNGLSTIKYSYKVRIDSPGTFQLGPAIVVYQGMPVESNVLSITVVEQQKSKHDKNHKKAFLTLKLDKDQVVVGQKINCVLTFYYTDDGIVLNQVGQPDLADFHKKEEKNPIIGTEKKDGEFYKYVRWAWELFPKKPGKLLIPAHRADYEIQMKRKQPRGFGLFFGNHIEHKRVYSNAEHLHVDPLPAYAGQIDAIGNFKHMRAHIKPAVVKQGEAMVLTLEVEGDGDLQAIRPPKLKHMPPTLKYYESKHYIVKPKNNYEQSKKCFEYIIQGLKEGDWQIPKQTFTYFDVDSYAYKTLETVPLMIQILGNNKIKTTSLNNDEKVSELKQDNSISNEILPLNEYGSWHPVRERAWLPLWIFLLLMSIPFLFIIYDFIYILMRRCQQRYELNFRAQRAFKHALTQLKKATKKQDTTQIYHIMIQLFADRFQIPKALITQNSIEKKLKEKNVAVKHLQQWQVFFNAISLNAFGHEKHRNNKLFEQAQKWIEYLKTVL